MAKAWGNALAFAGALGLATASFGAGATEEIKGGSMGKMAMAPTPPTVSQDQLNKAPTTARTSCRPTAITRRRASIPPARSTRGNVARPACRLDLPDRHSRYAGDLADRRQRRDVCDDLVRPRLCARRQDRRSRSGNTSTRWVRSRPIAAAPTIAASRSTATRSMWRRSTPSSSRSTPRPARSNGRRRSPIPRRAIPRRWRRPRSRA